MFSILKGSPFFKFFNNISPSKSSLHESCPFCNGIAKKKFFFKFLLFITIPFFKSFLA